MRLGEMRLGEMLPNLGAGAVIFCRCGLRGWCGVSSHPSVASSDVYVCEFVFIFHIMMWEK